jgi:IS5 family transposase
VTKFPTACTWGCKKNSQGNVETWKGYKLHLDVSDTGFPISALVTGANVHDSQVAIPLEKMTEHKVQHLYSVMDAAYDADPIETYIRGRGRIPLIDHNKRRGTDRQPFTPAQKNRYKVRTTVERANAHLKDWLIPHQIGVRGHAKVTFLLMCGVVVLAAVKALQYFILPALQKG